MSAGRRDFAATVAVTFLGQLCAVGYEVAVAGRFGTRREADALALTLMIVLAAANEFATWVSALFVPHYAQARVTGGPAAAARFYQGSLALLVLGAGLVTALLLAAAPLLMGVLVPDEPARAAGVPLLRLFAPVTLLLPASVLLAGVLQTHDRFVLASGRQLFWYGGALAALLALTATLGVIVVPMGMVAGFVVFCAVLALDIHAAVDLPAGGAPAGPRLRRLAPPLWPLMLASAANYINVTIERGIAARLPEGSVAALTYAFRLMSFPATLFLLNATTMIFPTLATLAAGGETHALESLVRRALRLVFVFTLPLVALSIALAEPGIRLLLERGAFTADSTRLTALALTWYAPALVGIAGGQMLLSRVYQALHEIRRMVAIGVAAVVINVMLMLWLTSLIGFPGLPLAASITAIVLFIFMLAGLRRWLPGLQLQTLLAAAGRGVAAGVVCLAAARAAYHIMSAREVPALVAGVVVGLAAYGLTLILISREDFRLALELVSPRRTHDRASSA